MKTPPAGKAGFSARGPFYDVMGTATPLVPTTCVSRWYFFEGGTTHFSQSPAIVWWVDW
jgi:hypothetical protein